MLLVLGRKTVDMLTEHGWKPSKGFFFFLLFFFFSKGILSRKIGARLGKETLDRAGAPHRSHIASHVSFHGWAAAVARAHRNGEEWCLIRGTASQLQFTSYSSCDQSKGDGIA
jgi:hypothetical protein